MYLEKLLLDKQGCCQHRIGNSGADSCKFNICNSIEHLYKIQADVFQIPHHRQYVAVSGNRGKTEANINTTSQQ